MATLSNYVKFRRGTPDAFAKLSSPDIDTLYFIYEEDETTGELYLGNKLIAGAGDIIGATTLRALQDVLLSESLNDKEVLVYDISQSRWVNKPILNILTAFVGTNGTSVGKAGLVPAPSAEEANMFLRSDGTWAEIVVASETLVLQTIVGDTETHDDAIARIVGEAVINKGDVVILKELIANDKYQHISFVYDGEKWVAMDGNYDAENVYLANNLTITADVGVQKLDGAGSKVLETAGKNLKQVLDMILAARVLPEYTSPSISISCPEATSYEVGTTVTPTYTTSFENGSYTYDPGEDTGVEVTGWTVTFDGATLNTESGEFNSVIITDGYSKRIGAYATHSAGVAPEDNLGNVVTDAAELAECQIPAGDTSVKYSGYISGFRYMFYGSAVEAINLTSDNIRNLSKRQSSKSGFDMSIVEGANQVVIAIPASYTLGKIADKAAFGTDILEKFVEQTVSVAGAAAGYDTDYKVYVYSPDTALGANTYTISFK